jgi:ribonucleoside-triphosphate reductase (formate)
MKTECEVYSRVVGYLRPVKQWNEGKTEEFKDRECFSVGTNSEAESVVEE